MGKLIFFIYFQALDQNITYLELTVPAAAVDDDDLDEQCLIFCRFCMQKLRSSQLIEKLSFLNVLLSLICLHVCC